MRNNVLGNDDSSYKKKIYKRIIFCLLTVFVLVIFNVFILMFRNVIGKTLSLIINVLLDFVVLTLVTIFYDFKISKELVCFRDD